MRLGKEELDKIIKWLHKRDYTLSWGEIDQVLPMEGKVTIEKNKYELYSLLHECGHIMIYEKPSYYKEYGILEEAEVNGHLRKTNVYKYQKMKEEIMAWEKGFKLAKKLQIDIDEEEYFQEAAKWVGSYRRHL